MSGELRDYDGFDLAVGEIYGLRVWISDDYGRLRARYLTEAAAPWRPGINVAQCHALPAEGGSVVIGPAGGGMVIGTFRTSARGWGSASSGNCTCPACRVAPDQPVKQADHSAPSEDCTCGFYAYTGIGSEVRNAGGLIVGVIRGTGRTLIGAKGFRCEKAEIVALLDPVAVDNGSDWSTWRRDQLRTVYPDVPLLDSKQALLEFAPIESTAPDPTSDEFWTLP